MSNHPNRNKPEFFSGAGDMYRVVPVGIGWGIALWNAHFKAWIGDAKEEFMRKRDAIAEAKRRAEGTP